MRSQCTIRTAKRLRTGFTLRFDEDGTVCNWAIVEEFRNCPLPVAYIFRQHRLCYSTVTELKVETVLPESNMYFKLALEYSAQNR